MKIDLKQRQDESGRYVFTLNHTIQAEPRLVSADNPKKISNAKEELGEASEEAPIGDGWVRQKWRLISAVQAWPTTDFWEPQLIDYGHDKGKALSEAVAMVNAVKPDLTWNHSTDVKDVAGFIDNAAWEEESDIPPGINGELVVDPEFDPKAAKGLSVGLLRSGSIGVTAEMRRSHESMPIEKFVSCQGDVVNGETVRWLLDKITSVRHMALVPYGSGADANAGRRGGVEAIAAEHAKPTRSKPMEAKLLEMMEAVCEAVKVDVTFKEGGAPEDFVEKITKKFAENQAAIDECKEIVAGNDKVSVKEMFSTLRSKLRLAEYGDAFILRAKEEALKWFDSAKVNPDESEMSAINKRLRKRIEDSDDIDFIQDQIEEYRERSEMRFALNRSSRIEEIPDVDSGKATTNMNPDIVASVRRMFAKGGKE